MMADQLLPHVLAVVGAELLDGVRVGVADIARTNPGIVVIRM
jgi:hypothetical protein